MEFTRYIDNGLYSRKALAQAREAYHQYCTVRAQPQATGEVAITVSVKPEYRAEARNVTLAFWNFFLDTSCKDRLENA